MQYRHFEKLLIIPHQPKLLEANKTPQTSLTIAPDDYVCEISCAFADILKYLQITTNNGKKITVGAAKGSENK